MTLIVIMGVSGAGKSTIGSALAAQNDWPFLEGDDFHPDVNVKKMAGGTPLTNVDREAWIDAMARAVRHQTNPILVLACSALNDFVRERLMQKCGRQVIWINLELSRETLLDRLKNRKGHFMKADMLDSQIEAFRPPVEAFSIQADKDRQDVLNDISLALMPLLSGPKS